MARSKAGISLEKAAKDTRIRVQRLRELESDDFSGFTHPTYARLFLLDYAEYLGVPQDEIRPLLPDQAGAAPGGFQYIDALAEDLPAAAKSSARRRRRIIASFVAVLVLLLFLAGGLLAYIWIKRIEAVARSKSVMEMTAPAEVPTAPTSDAVLLSEPPQGDAVLPASSPAATPASTPPQTFTP